MLIPFSEKHDLARPEVYVRPVKVDQLLHAATGRVECLDDCFFPVRPASVPEKFHIYSRQRLAWLYLVLDRADAVRRVVADVSFIPAPFQKCVYYDSPAVKRPIPDIVRLLICIQICPNVVRCDIFDRFADRIASHCAQL